MPARKLKKPSVADAAAAAVAVAMTQAGRQARTAKPKRKASSSKKRTSSAKTLKPSRKKMAPKRSAKVGTGVAYPPKANPFDSQTYTLQNLPPGGTMGGATVHPWTTRFGLTPEEIRLLTPTEEFVLQNADVEGAYSVENIIRNVKERAADAKRGALQTAPFPTFSTKTFGQKDMGTVRGDRFNGITYRESDAGLFGMGSYMS